MRELVGSVYYRGNINGTYNIKQNIQNGTIPELYADDKKPSRNTNDILKSYLPYIKKVIKNILQTTDPSYSS